MTENERFDLAKILRGIKKGVPGSWAKACETAAVYVETTPNAVTADLIRDAQRWRAALKSFSTQSAADFTASVDQMIEFDKAARRLEAAP